MEDKYRGAGLLVDQNATLLLWVMGIASTKVEPDVALFESQFLGTGYPKTKPKINTFDYYRDLHLCLHRGVELFGVVLL